MLSYLEQADPVVLVDTDGLHGNGVYGVLLDPERVEGGPGVGLVLADKVAVYLHLRVWRRTVRVAVTRFSTFGYM